MTTDEFANKIKTKYPQYKAVDNAELVNKIVAKYPSYASQVDGFGKKPEVAEAPLTERLGTIGLDAADKIKEDLSGQGGYQEVPRRAVDATATAFSVPIKAAAQLVPQSVREAVKPAGEAVASGFKSLTDALSNIPGLANFVYSHPKVSKAIDEVLGTGAGLGEIAADITAVDAGGVRVPKAGVAATQKTAQVVADTAGAVADVAGGATDVIKTVAGGAARIPGRVKTNLAEKAEQQAAIQELPTKIAQDAAHDGVDINDVKAIHNIPAEQKNPIRQLAQVVRDYADGKSKVHPEEIVGRPIIDRVKALEKVKAEVGPKIGAAANEIGHIAQNELITPVFESLQKVPGLTGLKIGEDGALDFTDTVLQTGATKADRSAISQIFKDAVADGSGKQKHLLRQELFEVLDGKKKGLAQITGTQEKAFQAVRQGLANVLEGKSAGYKALNQTFAKAATPITLLQKFLKASTGLDEDLLHMKAGLLARRLTSNAGSGPELKAVLRMLDKATKVPGKAALSVEHLQDAYNIFSRYYPEIVNKTGLRGEITHGIEGASGLLDAAGKIAKNFAGKSDAVKRAAFEKALEEVLKR